MKRLLLALLLLPTLLTAQQVTYDTTIGGWPAVVTRDVNHWRLDSVQGGVFLPGVGEFGNDVSLLKRYGPAYWVTQGWDGRVPLGNGFHSPVIISLQPPNTSVTAATAITKLQIILNTFKIKRRSFHLLAISAGGAIVNKIIRYKATATDDTWQRAINSLYVVMGVDPVSGNVGSGIPFPQSMGNYAGIRARQVGSGGRELFMYNQFDADRQSTALIKNFNDSVPGSGLRIVTSYGSNGGHCCFENYFNPSVTFTPASNANVVSGSMPLQENVYQWMLRNGGADTSLAGAPPVNLAPTVSAGVDKNIALPTSSTSVTGTASDPEGLSVTTAWTFRSGPATPTFGSPASLTTTVTNLTVAGTYVIRLTATDPAGNSNFDETSIIVAGAPSPCIANAGADISVERGTTSVDLNGTASTGAGLAYSWRLVSTVDFDWKGQVKRGNDAIATALILPIGFSPYKYELTVTASGGCVSRDTMQVNVTYGEYPEQSTTNWHYATSGDLDTIPNANSGDVIISGANNGSYGGKKINIDIATGSGITLGPGQKILIRGGRYNSITLSPTAGTVRGSYANPIIITNYEGQVEATYMEMGTMQNVKVTGKYVPGVSGDIEFPGHAGGNYAHSRGDYGIFLNNMWQSLGTNGLRIYGTTTDSIEVEYVEVGNGNFAGMMIKKDASTDNYDGFRVHDCYIHDIHSEAMYVGSTSNTGQHGFHGFIFENNRVVNAGGEIFQFQHALSGNRVRNNVFINSADNWRSPFGRYQDNTLQASFQNGNNRVENNIWLGTGISMIISGSSLGPDAANNDTIHFKNNLFLYGWGQYGTYFDGSGIGTGKVNIEGNYLGRNSFHADSIYSDGTGTNQATVFRSAATTPFLIRGNVTDNTGGKTQLYTGSNITATANSVATIEAPIFEKSGWNQNTNFNISTWSDSVYNTWKDEGASPSGVRWKKPIYFQVGDTALCFSKYYISRVANNHGHLPKGTTDAYWQLLTWDGYDYPDEDYRQKSTSKYRNITTPMGLTDTPADAPVTPAQRAVWKSARRLRIKP